MVLKFPSIVSRYALVQRARMCEFKEKPAEEVWLGDSKVGASYFDLRIHLMCSFHSFSQHHLHAGLLLVIIVLPLIAGPYLFNKKPENSTKTLNIADEDIQDAETAEFKGDRNKIAEVKGLKGK